MQWYMCISYVVPQFCRQLQNTACISFPEWIAKPVHHALDMPGQNTMLLQGIFCIACYSALPGTRQTVERRRPVMVDVNVMARSFRSNSISSLIRICCMGTEKFQLRFIEHHHFRRQGKYRQAVDAPVRKESPALQRSGK